MQASPSGAFWHALDDAHGGLCWRWQERAREQHEHQVLVATMQALQQAHSQLREQLSELAGVLEAKEKEREEKEKVMGEERQALQDEVQQLLTELDGSFEQLRQIQVFVLCVWARA